MYDLCVVYFKLTDDLGSFGKIPFLNHLWRRSVELAVVSLSRTSKYIYISCLDIIYICIYTFGYFVEFYRNTRWIQPKLPSTNHSTHLPTKFAKGQSFTYLDCFQRLGSFGILRFSYEMNLTKNHHCG